MEIQSVSFSREGFKPYVKSPVIWRHHDGNHLSPLCYLTKPKSVSKEDWEWFLDRFDFTITKEPKRRES